METIMPVLEMDVLREKTNEFAMKGALKSIEEYYTGYNSPFRKAIDAELAKREIGYGLDLPDIISLINNSLTNEIDAIANAAIAKTFVPMVKRFLTREKDEVKFSEILKEFIEATDAKNMEDCSIDIEQSQYGWLDINLNITPDDKYKKERAYKLTLHEDSDSKKETIKKYQFLSLPWGWDYENTIKRVMKLKIEDGATLELPYTPDVLKDNFISFIARLIICKSKITMDCRDFEEEMFPERCHCD